MSIEVSSEQKKINSEKTVVVGMSGGVDSSVAAAILKEQGFNVIGMFMKNWEEEDENGVCMASKDYEDVIKVCEKLDIQYHSVEFVKEYKEQVFKYFLEEYEAGHTPNPDILCNREIKFKVFYDHAISMGADLLAMGHYCQSKKINGESKLVKGVDNNKDQTYFLYTIRKEVLNNVIFPVGDLEKSEVREIARKYDLATKDKKDSTGICFIGERNFRNFLSSYIPGKSGDFENLSGEVVGKHYGSAYYTNGQRKGLGLGGPGEPWFVIDKDVKRNVVVVERGGRHPAMFCDDLVANELSWVSGEFNFELPYRCKAKVRYRQKDQDCVIVKIENGSALVTFDKAQRAVAVRQSIVFYDGDVCLGGGMVESAGKSYFEMNKEVPDEAGD